MARAPLPALRPAFRGAVRAPWDRIEDVAMQRLRFAAALAALMDVLRLRPRPGALINGVTGEVTSLAVLP